MNINDLIQRSKAELQGLIAKRAGITDDLTAMRAQDDFDVPAAEPGEQVMTEAPPPNYED